MAVDKDTDVRIMFKGNDEHGYVYVSRKDSLVRSISSVLASERGRLGLLMKVHELEEVIDGMMVVLQKRYKQVAHTVKETVSELRRFIL